MLPSKPPQNGVSLQGKIIFVVEDNLENRIITQLSLLKTGARIEFDRWGRDTVKRLRAVGRVDLIILDLMFPNGVTGYSIFDQIHQEPDLRDIPVVAVSAAEASSAIAKCREKGFAGFIAKPIDDDIFAEQISRLTNGEKIWHTG